MTTGTTHAALTRIIRQYKPRGYAFYDRFTGDVARSGRTSKGAQHATISRLLEWAYTCPVETRPERVYITGGDVASDRPGWVKSDDMAIDRYWSEPCLDGWSISRWHREPWSVTYRRGAVAVDVAMAANWYGDEHDAVRCDKAHTLLSVMLRQEFDKHAVLMGSPGRTGADLVQRTLPADIEYPAVAEPVREILLHNFSQGRMEHNELYDSSRRTIPGVWVLDARWAYAGSLRHLPIAPVTHDRKHPEWKGYRKAVYKIRTRVPDDWAHIGLVPTWSQGEGRTVWPHKPGTFIDGAWLTGAELALVYEQAWPVEITEAIYYAPEDAPGHDPARRFIEAMVRLREWALLNTDDLALRAARHLVIDTVGYWHRAAVPERRFVPYGPRENEIPRDALLVLPVKNGIRYTVPAPLDPATDPLYRPEWSVQVWGASRAKLNRQALEWPAKRILWLRNDSIVLDQEPHVEDTGKIGAWRLKSSYVGECEPPRTETEYRELMRGAQ